MPLEEMTIVDIREEMALAALGTGATVTEAAIRFGVSRPTVRLWRDRYRQRGRPGHEDRSHAPKSCPHRTDSAIEELIVEERRTLGLGLKETAATIERGPPGHRVSAAFDGRQHSDAPWNGWR